MLLTRSICRDSGRRFARWHLPCWNLVRMTSPDPYQPPSALQEVRSDCDSPKLANMSLLLILLPFVAAAVFQLLWRDSQGLASNLFFGCCGVAIIGGFFTAIAALVTRKGKKGVIVRAGFALLLSGGIFASAAIAVKQGRERRRERQTAAETERAAMEGAPSADAARSEASAVPIERSGEVSQAGPARSTGGAEDLMNGDNAVAMRISSGCMVTIDEASKAHAAVKQRLYGLGDFIPGNLATRATLARWREALTASITASEKYFELNRGLEAKLVEALQREKMPEPFIRHFLMGFLGGRNQSPAHLLSMKARAGDLRGCKALLDVVELLDREFGAWTPSEDGKWAGMKNPAAQEEYNNLVGVIANVGREQDSIANEQKALKTAQR
jgi:hypothetical protein